MSGQMNVQYRGNYRAALLLLLAVLIVYLPAANGGFVFDDVVYVSGIHTYEPSKD